MDIKNNPRFMLLVLFFCLSMKAHLSLGADTISANQSLSGDQTIVSAGEVFELGFFKPGNSSRYYIGMWYKNVSEQTIVWVANREEPIFDRFLSVLRISDGNLVLFNEPNIPIWSTNLNSTTSSSVEAVLQDSGNLVLRDGSNSLEPLWQSFDYPTHSWLPGAKIGYNNLTKKNQLLTSWKNPEDPAPGLFSLEIDPNGSSAYFTLWNRSEQYWTTGTWNGQSFSSIPEMKLNYVNNFSFISNKNESYFIYNSSIVSRFIMDVSGQIRQLAWLENVEIWNLLWSLPRTQCEVYAYCGAFGSCNQKVLPVCNCLTGFEPKSVTDWNLTDYSDGCVRKTNLQGGNISLGNGERDRFFANPYMRLPKHPQIVNVGSNAECESICLSNFSHIAYAYDIDNDECSIWIGDLLDLEQLAADDSNGKTLHIKLAASEFSSPNNNNTGTVIDNGSPNNNYSKGSVIGIVVGSVAGIILVIVFIYIWRRKVGKKQENRNNIQGNLPRQLYDTERSVKDLIDSCDFKEEDKKGIDVPYFDLESILAATDYFSNVNKLGQGGYGPVYKGMLGDQEIAVKRLSSVSSQGLQEFKNEVVLIAKLQHRNLVKLLGYCVKGDEKILLYEYMPNKSLDFFIFDSTRSVLLGWEMRVNIILGTARGLLYLHRDSRLRVIHRDLKTSNILLDEEMNPKISDFGLARIVGGKQTEANTNRVVGTYGYMSPEYASDGLFSVKSDVFSFGVVVLEIISGRKNTRFFQSQDALSLLGYTWKLWREEKVLDLMDPTLHKTCNTNEFLKCVSVGLLCVQDDPSDRPTMSNVVVMLGSENATLPTPKQPAFIVRRGLSSSDSSSDRPETNTELTNSLEDGR